MRKIYSLKKFPGIWDKTNMVETPFPDKHKAKNWRLYDAAVRAARRSTKRPSSAVHGSQAVVVRHHGNVVKLAYPKKVYTIVY